MSQIYVLFEHAAGFAAFRTKEYEEIAIFLPQVQKSILDSSNFRSIVSLVAFQPFSLQKEALENMKCIAAGKLSIDLQIFLENNIPRTQQSRQTIVLGVVDPELAIVISDKLGIKCITSGIIQELTRGIRCHFSRLIRGFKDKDSIKSTELALARHYSKEKVGFDSTQHDLMIIQSLNLIDDLEKDIRIFTIRVREWYSYHFPELFKIIDNIEMYIKCVDAIGNRKNMPEDMKQQLNSLIRDTSKVEAILQAIHTSMGMDITSCDLENMRMFCNRILSLIRQRQSAIDYLKAKMKVAAPNISKLVGEMIGSRLISRAGGLSNLAKLPASTVQVLGAEKNFFRTLKGKENPNWGVLAMSSFVGKIGKKRKGRMSRILANKCSLACKVDCFSKSSSDAFGTSVLQQVEELVASIKYKEKKINSALCKKNATQNLQEIDSVAKSEEEIKDVNHDLTKNETSFHSTHSKKLDEKISSEEDNDKISDEEDGEKISVEADEVLSDSHQNVSNSAIKWTSADDFTSDENNISESFDEISPKPVAKSKRKRKFGSVDLSTVLNNDEVSHVATNGIKKSSKKKKLKK